MSRSEGKGRQAVLIAGPTASGKSGLAVSIALRLNGVIVNADSMQVYDVLSVLTARPNESEMGNVPHHLYGFVSPAVRFSTGAYVTAVSELLAKVPAERPIVFVGGTGLYFDALINGFMQVPEVDAAIVARLNDEVAALDRNGRTELLRARDPNMAGQLKEADPQRVVRALSVMEATGRSLADWQDEPVAGVLAEWSLTRIVLSPDRDELRQCIAQRFGAMMQLGAADEVRRLLALDLATDLPAMKAIGVREIAAVLAGEMEDAEATQAAVTATHQYAKRQRTWFRNRMADWNWFKGADEALNAFDLK